MKEKVEAAKDLGILSKQLATIMLDVPVEFDAQDFELSEPDIEGVKTIFQELEFRRLTDNFIKTFSKEATTSAASTTISDQKNKTDSNKTSAKEKAAAGAGQFSLFGSSTTTTDPVSEQDHASSRNTINNTDHLYQSIAPGMAMKLFVQNLLKQKSVCFDTETTGLNPLTAELVGIAFSWEVGKGFYVPFSENKDEAQALIEQLRPFFEDDIKGKLFDTMLAHYLINPDMRHNMDILAETYLNYTPVSITELIGKKGKNQLSMRQVPLEKQTEYAVEDADITLQLKEHFEKELGEANTQKLFDDIEVPLLRVLADMELEGINLDEAFLNSLSEELTTDITTLEKQIYEAAGEETSPKKRKLVSIVLLKMCCLIWQKTMRLFRMF